VPEPTSRNELVTRRVTTEEMVRSQLDRITAIRSDVARRDRVQAWHEALEALADLVAPWAEGDEAFLKAWDTRPVAVVDLGDGSTMPCPTAADCREAQRILMAMMDRQGLLVKRRNVSGPAPRTFPGAAGTTTTPEVVPAP